MRLQTHGFPWLQRAIATASNCPRFLAIPPCARRRHRRPNRSERRRLRGAESGVRDVDRPRENDLIRHAREVSRERSLDTSTGEGRRGTAESASNSSPFSDNDPRLRAGNAPELCGTVILVREYPTIGQTPKRNPPVQRVLVAGAGGSAPARAPGSQLLPRRVLHGCRAH